VLTEIPMLDGFSVSMLNYLAELVTNEIDHLKDLLAYVAETLAQIEAIGRRASDLMFEEWEESSGYPS
jgi:hypothetical protein